MRPTLLICLLFTNTLFALKVDPKLQESLNKTVLTHTKAALSQSKINTLHAKEQELFAQYKATLQEIQTLKVYKKQLQNLVASQEAEKISINEQILEVDITAQGIMPLMKKMIEGLDTFTKLDIPFLQEEREQRVLRLSKLLSQSKLSVSQKYRSIMEAYAIELEYGNTLETYSAMKGDTSMNFLKVGRIGLYYLSLDEDSVGMYDPIKKTFVELDSSYVKYLKRAMKIAKKQQAPNLLELPLILTSHDVKGAN